MKKLIIGGIVFIIALIGVVYTSVIGQDAEALNEVGSNINLYAIIAAVAIVAISVGVVLKYVNQMQNDTATGVDSGHEWDGIREFTNDIPKGWAIMYIALIVWFIYYLLIAFPVGTYSQIGEYNDEVKAHKEKFEKEHANLNREQLIEMGESVFSVNCAPCHGYIGDGQGGLAADITHRLDAKSVKYVIENGSSQLGYPGGMPAGMAFGKDVDIIAEYVAGGMKGEQPAAFATCAGCHGPDGKGIEYVGPNINVFRAPLVTYVLEHGKKGAIGAMPSFKGRLTDTQIKAVATFVETLSK